MSWSLERLDDYVSGSLGADEAAAFEEELFARAAEGDPELAFFDEVAEDLTFLAAHHQFGESYTRAEVEALRAANPHTVDVEFGQGGVVPIPPWPADTERVIFHFDRDFRGFEDIEISTQRPDGTPLITFRGVTPDPQDGHIYGVCFASLARLAFALGPLQGRISGVRAGQRELIGEVETRPASG